MGIVLDVSYRDCIRRIVQAVFGLASGAWSLEPGESGIWSLESGICNLEPGAWSLNEHEHERAFFGGSPLQHRPGHRASFIFDSKIRCFFVANYATNIHFTK